MNENFVDLMDGTRLEVKVNFGTLYYITQEKIDRVMKKIEEEKDLSDKESMQFAAVFIYAILRSNGKKVTPDEALELMPPDMDSIKGLLNTFQNQMEKYKKKERAKQDMKKMQ